MRLFRAAEAARKEANKSDWQTRYMVLPGETPYWEMKYGKERQGVCSRQRIRAFHRDNPGSAAAARIRREALYPGTLAKAARKYSKTPKGKAACAKGLGKYLRTPKGKATLAKGFRKYRKTPKGKANYAKCRAQRRTLSTNPTLYGKRVGQLHELHEPCAYPGCINPIYQLTHQIDHILALALGGTDDWDDLRPICIKCHRKKSGEDKRKIAALKRAGYDPVWVDIWQKDPRFSSYLPEANKNIDTVKTFIEERISGNH
jgi:5-methylcytosine-specific restriction endonuclease McrA